MKKHLTIKVSGKVQGVGFRYQTQKTANSLNIKGLVKNLGDGSVHIEAEGEEPDLESFVSWCKVGPQLARVQNVSTIPCTVVGYSEFNIA